MSIIRENQIKQIRDEDNRIRKIVFDRYKATTQNYIENVKPPQVLDENIVTSNKKSVMELLNSINLLIIKLNIIENDTGEFMDVLGNLVKGEYRKLIEGLNIVKPFNIWEEMMKLYTSPKINTTTKERIVNEVQKLTPYLVKLNEFLTKTINDLSRIIEADLLVKDLKKREDEGLINKDEYLMLKDNLWVNCFNFIFDEEFNPKEQEDLTLKRFLENEIDAYDLIKIYIEAKAFYYIIQKQIEQNSLTLITKQMIAFEIAQIINSIYANTNNADVNNFIIGLFKGTELPELAPYFKFGYGDFVERFDELDAMQGAVDEDEDEEGYNEGDEGDEEGINRDALAYVEDEKEDEPDVRGFRDYVDDEVNYMETGDELRRILREGFENIDIEEIPSFGDENFDEYYERALNNIRRQDRELVDWIMGRSRFRPTGRGKKERKQKANEVKRHLNKLLMFPKEIIEVIKQTLPESDQNYINKKLTGGARKLKVKAPAIQYNESENEAFYSSGSESN